MAAYYHSAYVLLYLSLIVVGTNGRIDQIRDENGNIDTLSDIFGRNNANIKHPSRRSLLSLRTLANANTNSLLAEVRTLVEGFNANSEKLDTLIQGMDIILNSASTKYNGYSEIMKHLEALNPFFVSLYVLLVDVALSTSSRLAVHQENIFEMSDYFRKNITSETDKEMFDNNMFAVYKWYLATFNQNYTSCEGVRDDGFRKSGAYVIKVPDTEKLATVWCDQQADAGGWLVIQRRQDGSENFYRSWADYQDGFGDISKEFWLGNEILHLLTRKHRHELRVDLTDFEGNSAYAKYSSFSVGSAAQKYKLMIGGFSGTAGDSLARHNGMGFTTKDRDNDQSPKTSCAEFAKGGWWYQNCFRSNLNGLYYEFANDNVTNGPACWYTWKNNHESLKKIEMKIRPLE